MLNAAGGGGNNTGGGNAPENTLPYSLLLERVDTDAEENVFFTRSRIALAFSASEN
jgi:hypothetical protein